MKIKENIYLLELPNITPGRNDSIYPTLIKKGQELTLIDTGFPNQVDDIKSAIEKENLTFTNLKNIILTHHDIDHMGNVKAILKLLPQIELIVYEDEADYINGSKTPCKVEMLEKNFHKLNDENKQLYKIFKYFFENNKINPDKLVKDGDIIDVGEKLKVIATPGHTMGHMSLYIDKYKLLIAGDLFMKKDNKITTCSEGLNYNQEIYLNFLKKIEDLPIESVICYHGGYFIGSPLAKDS